MYAKLINNRLEYAPNNLKTENSLILNFNKNTLLLEKHGYKEVVDNKPNYDINTHYLSIDGYVETEDKIIINYKINEIVVDNTPTLEERVAELEKMNKELLSLMKTLEIKEGGN